MRSGSRYAKRERPASRPCSKRPVRSKAYLLLLPLLAALPSACGRTALMIPDAPGCVDYVPAQLVQPTQKAPAPPDDSSGAWVAFGVDSDSRVEEANLKPPAIVHIIRVCEEKHAAAVAKARRDATPWWRRL